MLSAQNQSKKERMTKRPRQGLVPGTPNERRWANAKPTETIMSEGSDAVKCKKEEGGQPPLFFLPSCVEFLPNQLMIVGRRS